MSVGSTYIHKDKSYSGHIAMRRKLYASIENHLFFSNVICSNNLVSWIHPNRYHIRFIFKYKIYMVYNTSDFIIPHV